MTAGAKYFPYVWGEKGKKRWFYCFQRNTLCARLFYQSVCTSSSNRVEISAVLGVFVIWVSQVEQLSFVLSVLLNTDRSHDRAEWKEFMPFHFVSSLSAASGVSFVSVPIYIVNNEPIFIILLKVLFIVLYLLVFVYGKIFFAFCTILCVQIKIILQIIVIDYFTVYNTGCRSSDLNCPWFVSKEGAVVHSVRSWAEEVRGVC